MFTFPALLAVALYILIGAVVCSKTMAHIRANAFNDTDFFGMVVQDARPSLSMILPKLTLVAFWPLAVAFALLIRLVTPAPNTAAAG